MSNTVKIKNKKKKEPLKVNYKLMAIVFAIFILIVVGLAVWASFHWGVGMGTVGVRPVTPEEADFAATDFDYDEADMFATDDVVTLTPEELEEMGISLDDLEEVEGAEDAAAEDAAAESGAEEAAETEEAE